MTSDRDDKLDELVAELAVLDERLWKGFREKDSWQLKLGRIRIRGNMGSQAITGVFLAFCLACFLGGAAATFFQATKELGIAMVVGAIFAGGSFIIQFWAVQVQYEHALVESTLGEESRRELRRLLRHRSRLVARIESLRPGHFEGSGP